MMDPAYPSSRIKQCLDIAKPRAWVQIKEAGDTPADLTVCTCGILKINSIADWSTGISCEPQPPYTGHPPALRFRGGEVALRGSLRFAVFFSKFHFWESAICLTPS